MFIQPFHLLLAALAHWVNKEQAAIIDYLKEENQVLRARGSKRIRFTNEERCLLAVKAKVLGRSVLRDLCPIVTPDTLLRWHRKLVAKKYDGSRRRVGRPRVMEEIEELIVRMAKENPSWGYTRIRGALSNVGHEVGRSTIARILKNHGIEPEPRRGVSWKSFLQAHWEVIAAADMFTVEIWVGKNLVRYHVMFAIELATRRVNIMGIVPEPDGVWMEQIARNATDAFSGFLVGKKYLIIDRDPRFTAKFRSILECSEVDVIRIPPRSPNLNAYAERFVRSIKEECLSRMIFFSERPLRSAVRSYMEHYHHERNHQGIGNRLIQPAGNSNGAGEVVREPRLGGLLNHYSRAA